jgi:hypothetical protein
VTTRIWIEPQRHSDARAKYNSCGQFYRTRLGGPEGETLVEATTMPVGPSCRVLMGMGVTGPFGTWRAAVPYPCMRGDIEKASGLGVEERSTKSPWFTRWQPHHRSQNALSRASGSAPARGRCSLRHEIARSSAGREQLAEATEQMVRL